jgi:hypothetical protein
MQLNQINAKKIQEAKIITKDRKHLNFACAENSLGLPRPGRRGALWRGLPLSLPCDPCLAGRTSVARS